MLCPHRVEALNDDVCLTSVCLSCTSGLSREQERPRKTKIGTEVGHITPHSDTTFKVKRSRSTCGGGGYCGGLPHSLLVVI